MVAGGALAWMLVIAVALPPPADHAEGDIVSDGEHNYFLAGDAWVRIQETRVHSVPLGKRPGSDVVTAESINAEDLRRRGARTLGDVLRQTAGIQVNGSRGIGEEVTLDGLDGRHVLVLIDGRPVVGKVNNRVDVSRIAVSPESVKKIEIIRGPMSAVYGSEAIGGVINIITKKPSATPMAKRRRRRSPVATVTHRAP
jgi:outer membrane cobalamin receptor